MRQVRLSRIKGLVIADHLSSTSGGRGGQGGGAPLAGVKGAEQSPLQGVWGQGSGGRAPQTICPPDPDGEENFDFEDYVEAFSYYLKPF